MVAWDGLKEHLCSEQRIHAILSMLKPCRRDERTIGLTLSSSTQQSVVEQFRTTIVAFLNETLHTADLQLYLDVRPTEVKVQAYTVEGKYATMVSQNPCVERLQRFLQATMQ